MKKLSLALLTLSILTITSNTFAAEGDEGGSPGGPSKAGSGTISFTGIVNNDACSIEGADLNKNISVTMGEVSIKDMGTADSPIANGKVSSENFSMNVNCNAGTKVSMIFEPTTGAGSGILEGTKVLRLTDGLGAAKNIGIALIDANGEVIDLTSRTTAKIENNLQDNNTSLKFSAAYVTSGDLKDVVAGRADATLPFTLEYE